MLLQKCKFLAVPYSRHPWPRKTDQREWCPHLDSQRALYQALQNTMGEETKRAELARPHAFSISHWLPECYSARGVGLKIILPLRRLEVQ